MKYYIVKIHFIFELLIQVRIYYYSQTKIYILEYFWVLISYLLEIISTKRRVFSIQKVNEETKLKKYFK